jgi:hypothetical protein
MPRELIFLSPLREGETVEQLAHRAWLAFQAYREATARGEPFEPVLDVKPTPEQDD